MDARSKRIKKKWKFKLNVVKNNIQLDSSGGVTLIIRNLENEDGIFNSKSKGRCW